MHPPSFPERHKPLAQAHQWSPWLGRLVGRDSAIPQHEWQRVGEGLLQGDPLADAVAQWMHAHGAHRARKIIANALEHGSDSLSEEVHPSLEALLAQVESPPEWVDFELIDHGRRVIDRCHPAPDYVLRNMGLLAGYTWSDLNQPLVMTGALESGAMRRVAQTMRWFADVVSPEGLRRGGRGYCSTLHVRLLHATVRRHLSRHKDWDHADRGVPINQTDMAATWLAFSVVLLAGLRLLGVYVSRHDAYAVMHLWKYACWLMGIDESWLTDDEGEGRHLLYRTLSTYRGANDTSVALARALAAQTADLPFPRWRPLKWRVETAKHLSVSSLVLGPAGMRRLGLAWVPPWYPAGVFGWNMARSLVLRIPSPLQRRAEARGLAAREALVALHFEDADRTR